MSHSPFKFLDSYTKEDKEIFFGREAEVEDVYTKIFQSKILLVYGASGTGKSSLVSCGLANKFQDTDWLPVNVRRGVNINDSLRQQLAKNMLTPLSSSGGASLPKMLKSVYLDHFKPIFLVFDQFEELFIFGDRDEWIKFIASVREVLDSELQVRFVFIIRGEYLEYLTEFEQVLPEVFGNRIRVERMTRTNAVNCITGPCHSFEIEVESGFPENLLARLSPSKTEIELTYLQVFLDRIFKMASEKPEEGKIVFSNTLLDELGNVGDVLSQFLDEQIELIPDSVKASALLKAFVSTDATKKQITSQQAAEFVKTIGQDLGEKQVDRLIQELVNRRILKDKDEAGRYELRHDSIATKIFEKITTYERDLIEVNQFITYAFGEHEKRDFLLNESDLNYVTPFLDKIRFQPKIIDFIEKSRKAVARGKRSLRQLFVIIFIIGILFFVSLFSLIYSLRQKDRANQLASLAQAESVNAKNQQRLAEEQRANADNQKRLAEQNAEDALNQSVVASKQRNLAEAQRKIAENSKAEALRQQQLAEFAQAQAVKSQLQAELNASEAMRQKLIVESEKKKSDSLRAIADYERKKADTLRMISIAQALSVRSKQMGDTRLKGLLAMLAYQLNAEYNGYAYQADIYDGLYDARRAKVGDDYNNMKPHGGPVRAIACGTAFVYTAGEYGIAKLTVGLQPIVNKVLIAGALMDRGGINTLLVDREEKMLLAGTDRGNLLVYSTVDGKKLGEKKLHSDDIFSLVLGVGHTEAVTAQYSWQTLTSEILSTNLQTFETKSVWKGENRINTLAVDPSGNLFAGFSNGSILKITMNDGQSTVFRRLTNQKIVRIAIPPNGKRLAASSESGYVWVFSLDGEGSDFGFQSPAISLSFSGDSKFLIVTTTEGFALVFNLDISNERPIALSDHLGWVVASGFTHGNRSIVTGDASGTVRVYPLEMKDFIKDFCSLFSPTFTEAEWNQLVGKSLPVRTLCR